jgi:formylglycine-generating enzyme required for sulfatase activity
MVWVTGVMSGEAAEDVAVMGNYVLVAAGEGGLRVFELQQSIYPPLAPPVISNGWMTLSWPALEGVRLEKCTNLALRIWQTVPGSDLTNSVSLPMTDQAAFFRLFKGQEFMSSDRLIWIPPGHFVMGSPNSDPDAWPWELPQTAVTLTHGFWIGKYLLTQWEYEYVTDKNPSHFSGDPNLPVDSVSWFDAVAYCEALTQLARTAGRISATSLFRLPTSAEWEYACRAGTTTRFYYGDDPGYARVTDYFWYADNSGGKTHPVGQKPPNPWGLYDMGGNVLQWVHDWWSWSLPGGSVVDPQGSEGPDAAYSRKVRAQAFSAPARDMRSTAVGGAPPDTIDSGIGFRVVLSPGQP